MGGSLAGLALAGVLVCASGPVVLLADTLILKDGTQIVARGQAVVVDGEVGFFGQDGRIQRFRVNDLDLQATKLTNLIANRKRAGQRPKYVIDDDNTRHFDPELSAAIQDCDDARSTAALNLCTQRLMASADRISADLTLKLRCKERFQNDWGAEALCKLGKEPPPGAVENAAQTPKGMHEIVEKIAQASRDIHCARLFPVDGFYYQVCRSAKE